MNDHAPTKVPFHLHRRAAEPATALLLTTTDVAELLALLVRLGADPLPPVYAVADGFLIELPQPAGVVHPHILRLRNLCPHLWLPADGELVPPLREDEARGLVRHRGLVFLPGGRVLAVDCKQPVPLSSFLETAAPRRGDWRAFPEPPVLADRIESITLDLPLPPPEEVLEAGGEGIGEESPRPEGSGVIDRVASKVEMGLGKTLMGLGNLLGWKGLARAGARMVEKAVERTPRLSESVLGQQEAALRDLLKKFREGKLDEALRRALPLGGAGDRGGQAATGSVLPFHNLFYSLGSLLGGGRGPASIWLGGYDVQAELAKEYRKAAEAAVQRGDYRRAAFIYGKLMQDYRRAADVLFQGGLFRDAALLYLKKLDDQRAAARAFEAAGEIDEAVALYRAIGDHVAAGDLLRRAGEEEAAFAEYQQAADKLKDRGEYLEAGELLLAKAGRDDLAEGLFREGWRQRPHANAVPCALRLARLFADRETLAELVELAGEARVFFDNPGHEVDAARFYNDVAELADLPALAPARDDVRDLALLGLAVKARQRVAVESRPGDLVSTLLGQSGTWPAALVSDARHAIHTAVKRPKLPAPRPSTRVRLGSGAVTAVCHAPATGDVFAAFDYGKIACFRPKTGEVVVIRERWDFTHTNSMAVDADGEILVTLQQTEGKWLLARYARRPNGAYHMEETIEVDHLTPLGLSLIILRFDGRSYVTLFTAHYIPDAAYPIGDVTLFPHHCDAPTFAETMLFRMQKTNKPCLVTLEWFGQVFGLESRPSQVHLGWTPNGSLTVPQAFLSRRGNEIELAGVSSSGRLNWSHLRLDYYLDLEQMKPMKFNVLANHSAVCDGGYRAAALVGPGRIAGVTASGIHWLRPAGKYLTAYATTAISMPEPVAAFPSPLTGEVLIVCQDGTLERVTVPS